MSVTPRRRVVIDVDNTLIQTFESLRIPLKSGPPTIPASLKLSKLSWMVMSRNELGIELVVRLTIRIGVDNVFFNIRPFSAMTEMMEEVEGRIGWLRVHCKANDSQIIIGRVPRTMFTCPYLTADEAAGGTVFPQPWNSRAHLLNPKTIVPDLVDNLITELL